MCKIEYGFPAEELVKFRRRLNICATFPLWPSKDNSFCRYLCIIMGEFCFVLLSVVVS